MPEGSDEVMIASGGGAMVKEMVADLVCEGLEESVTVAVKLTFALVVGVPESEPLEARVNPAGRVPPVTDQV